MKKEVKIDWQIVEDLVNSLLIQVKDEKFELICGVNRGGLLAGVMLSHALKIPHLPISVTLRDHTFENTLGAANLAWLCEEERRILVVDEINDTGETFAKIKDMGCENLKFASLYYNKKSKVESDFWTFDVEDGTWIVFPWES